MTRKTNIINKIWVAMHASMLKHLEGEEYSEYLIDAAFAAGETAIKQIKKLSLIDLLRIKYGKD